MLGALLAGALSAVLGTWDAYWRADVAGWVVTVVVAAGAHAIGLPVDGLREPDPANGLHTSDTVMRLDALPPRMVVIGGGFVACELAHVFASLGVHVTQVQRGPGLLRHHEATIAQRYTQVAANHYDVRLSATPTSVISRNGSSPPETSGVDGPVATCQRSRSPSKLAWACTG